MTACKSNLKNVGTALEMYATDNGGRFPSSLQALSPRYLKTLPTCPSASRITYGYQGLHEGLVDAYTVVCAGENHREVGQGPDFPQYTSKEGLRDGR